MFDTRLKSGDYIDYSVEYYRQNLKTFFIMTLIFHIPVTFVTFFLLDIGNLADNLSQMVLLENYEMSLLKLVLFYLGLILYSLYTSTILHSISLGTIKHTYEKLVNGVEYSAKQAVAYGFKRLLWYVLYMFLLGSVATVVYNAISFIGVFTMFAGFAEFGGVLSVIICVQFLVGCVAAVVYLLIRLFFVPHAISIERLDCFKAASLSWRMTKGKVRNVFWPIIFGVLFNNTMPIVIRSLNNLISFSDPLVNRILAALIMSISAVWYPILHINTTQLYIYLKHETGIMEFLKKLNDLVAGESDRITFGRDREVTG